MVMKNIKTHYYIILDYWYIWGSNVLYAYYCKNKIFYNLDKVGDVVEDVVDIVEDVEEMIKLLERAELEIEDELKKEMENGATSKRYPRKKVTVV